MESPKLSPASAGAPAGARSTADSALEELASAAAPVQRRPVRSAKHTDQLVKTMLLRIYDELFAHDGYASLKVEMRILRHGQKEVILDAGKQWRFVVDCPTIGSEPRSLGS